MFGHKIYSLTSAAQQKLKEAGILAHDQMLVSGASAQGRVKVWKRRRGSLRRLPTPLKSAHSFHIKPLCHHVKFQGPRFWEEQIKVSVISHVSFKIIGSLLGICRIK